MLTWFLSLFVGAGGPVDVGCAPMLEAPIDLDAMLLECPIDKDAILLEAKLCPCEN